MHQRPHGRRRRLLRRRRLADRRAARRRAPGRRRLELRAWRTAPPAPRSPARSTCSRACWSSSGPPAARRTHARRAARARSTCSSAPVPPPEHGRAGGRAVPRASRIRAAGTTTCCARSTTSAPRARRRPTRALDEAIEHVRSKRVPRTAPGRSTGSCPAASGSSSTTGPAGRRAGSRCGRCASCAGTTLERLRPQLEDDRRHEEDPDHERVHQQPERDGEADVEQALELRGQQRQNVPARIRPALVMTPPVSSRPSITASSWLRRRLASLIRVSRKTL